MDLQKFDIKQLLQGKIEVILWKEFSFTADCCVRGCHIFKLFWETPASSIFLAKHEVDPLSLIHDEFSIALVSSDWVTVSHIPKFMSKLMNFSSNIVDI